MLSFTIVLFAGFSTVSASYGELFQQFNSSTFELMRFLTHGPGKGVAYNWLAALVDDFGSRQVGSENLEKAIDFTVSRLKSEGFHNVHTQTVPNLPHWRRGDDSVTLIEPRRHRFNILAIDGSPPGDVTGEAVVVNSFAEIANYNISGKIVVIVEKWSGYGITAKYRRAANKEVVKGALGILVKSVTPFSIGLPHTGSGSRGSSLPSACMTIEEAEMLERMFKRGRKIVIRMHITSRDVGKVSSRNTVFEITGSTYPSEIVLLSAHMDSWDVGQGAIDDGGGMAVAWHALNVIKHLAERDRRFRPKRTLRAVFWTAEEQGYFGSKIYYNNGSTKGAEKFFFVSESDQGAFRPSNWNSVLRFQGNEFQMKKLDEIVKIINNYGIPLSVLESTDQGDIGFWAKEGVPSVSYEPDKGANYYFYFHHTEADYMTIFNDGDLEYTTAIFAALAHIIGNMDDWN
ncbi:hypothetical protein QR680_000035 [Steinernema hermaphroditum]|uniref:Carboxypeptidase Q n=1 Tax=Steinernema hermaphroditum TaxID=289476 RepID=A0AA39GUL6_9BILA|nr:hypothetical protein QR680_000035 [Steinernema hermaphroditum]